MTISYKDYCNYRPQQSYGKVMFLHLSVSHSVHWGGGRGVYVGVTHRTETSPQTETPLDRDLPQTETPWTKTPERPPGQSLPGQRQRPPLDRDPCGRYESDWNAFLFYSKFTLAKNSLTKGKFLFPMKFLMLSMLKKFGFCIDRYRLLK